MWHHSIFMRTHPSWSLDVSSLSTPQLKTAKPGLTSPRNSFKEHFVDAMQLTHLPCSQIWSRSKHFLGADHIQGWGKLPCDHPSSSPYFNKLHALEDSRLSPDSQAWTFTGSPDILISVKISIVSPYCELVLTLGYITYIYICVYMTHMTL